VQYCGKQLTNSVKIIIIHKIKYARNNMVIYLIFIMLNTIIFKPIHNVEERVIS